mmetsp:Transcript_22173/g.66645  ORF Transcript_22173/g.66645 Transcript_22173/m.66645 type:complete len:152 (+) Transcript_22173:3979-4434(+)
MTLLRWHLQEHSAFLAPSFIRSTKKRHRLVDETKEIERGEEDMKATSAKGGKNPTIMTFQECARHFLEGRVKEVLYTLPADPTSPTGQPSAAPTVLPTATPSVGRPVSPMHQAVAASVPVGRSESDVIWEETRSEKLEVLARNAGEALPKA